MQRELAAETRQQVLAVRDLGEHRAAGEIIGGVLRHPELTTCQRASVEHVESTREHVHRVTFGHRPILPLPSRLTE